MTVDTMSVEMPSTDAFPQGSTRSAGEGPGPTPYPAAESRVAAPEAAPMSGKRHLRAGAPRLLGPDDGVQGRAFRRSWMGLVAEFGRSRA